MGWCIDKDAVATGGFMGKDYYDWLVMPAIHTAIGTGCLCAMYFYFIYVKQ